MRVYAYLRASTEEQDARRAEAALNEFAHQQGFTISASFVENESGASLKRPELFRLISIAQSGDVLLVEQVDRLSRLNNEDWEQLRAAITEKGIRVVSLDLPTSWMMTREVDDFTARMTGIINQMLLEMLAAIARKDYEDRRRRQAEGITKAKEQGKYVGRKADNAKAEMIMTLRKAGKSYSEIQELTGAARSTIAKTIKENANGSE